MSEPQNQSDQSQWICGHCMQPLELVSVNVTYLGAGYPVNLYKCPQCGNVLIPEELAVGKMAEVEKILEDK